MAASMADFWCTDQGTSVSIVLIALSLLALAVNVFVGTFCFIYVRRMAKLHRVLKWLFYAIYILSISDEFIHLMAKCSCLSDAERESILPQLISIHLTLYLFTLLLILSMLVFRTYVTFSDSAYKPTLLQRTVMVILGSSTIICSIFTLLVLVIFPGQARLVTTVASIGGATYMATSVYAVGLFVHCLMKFVKAQANSIRNLEDEDNIALTKSQTKFIRQTSRYLSLLVIAIVSSMFTLVILGISLLFNQNAYAFLSLVMQAHITLDNTVNLILLCLQYPFADSVYYKVCGCNQRFWDRMLRTKTQRYMINKYRSSSPRSVSAFSYN